jgi:putative inorganic carbon (HCO3(-)) transporter
MAFGFTLLYLIFALLSPGALPPWLAALHVGEIVGGITILSLIPSLSDSKLTSIPDGLMVAGFLFIGLLSAIFNKGFSNSRDTMESLIPVVIVFFFVHISSQSLSRLRILSAVLCCVGIYIFASGLLAYIVGNFESAYLEPEKTALGVIYRFRGMGVLSDPNDTALYMITIVPLLFMRWKKGSTVANLFLSILPACILLGAVYFTRSRGAIVGLSLMLLFAFKDRLGTVKAGIAVGVMATGLIGFGMAGGRGVAQDDGGRVAAWMTALSVTAHHPGLGVGVGNFNEYNDTGLTAHNSYVLCMAETGLFGYVLWMGVLIANWIRLTRVKDYPKLMEKPSGEQEEPALVSPSGAVIYGRPRQKPQQLPVLTNERGVGAMAFAGAPAQNLAAAALPFHLQRGFDEDVPDSDEAFSSAAHAIRTALVGLLATAFFLSRTYSITVYIILGMATALWSLRLRSHPAENLPLGLLTKRTLQIVIGSIVFMILGTRLVGV